jgi:hypothetical protein
VCVHSLLIVQVDDLLGDVLLLQLDAPNEAAWPVAAGPAKMNNTNPFELPVQGLAQPYTGAACAAATNPFVGPHVGASAVNPFVVIPTIPVQLTGLGASTPGPWGAMAGGLLARGPPPPPQQLLEPWPPVHLLPPSKTAGAAQNACLHADSASLPGYGRSVDPFADLVATAIAKRY